MTKIITVTSQKGGVAKTTTAVAIAHGLARRWLSHETLLIDFDPQGHASIALGRDPEPGVFDLLVTDQPIANVLRHVGNRNMQILPSNSRTRTAENVLRTESDAKRTALLMANFLDAHGCDYAVIDTPPGGLFQEIAARIAAVIVIPVRCEALGLDGVAATLQMIDQLQLEPQVIVLPTMFDARLTEHNLNLATLREAYGALVAEPVPARVAVAEAAANGCTVWEYGNGNMAGVRAAYEAVIERVGGAE